MTHARSAFLCLALLRLARHSAAQAQDARARARADQLGSFVIELERHARR